MPDHESGAIPPREFLVACLCAAWCDTCRDYRPGFEALASRFPQADFLWLDIEDEAHRIGDLEVEDFPTLLIQRGPWVLFYGTMLPHLAHLHRTLDALGELTPGEAEEYVRANEQRREWQQSCNLRRFLDR
jgi:hypothetical protein